MMIESKLSFHTQVANKDFLAALTNLLRVKNIDFKEVYNKTLYLIKKWGSRFENQKDILPNFYEVYMHLKNNKVQFPEFTKLKYK